MAQVARPVNQAAPGRYVTRQDYGEERVISLGMIDAVLIIVVVHTDRQGVTRIISARPARRSERRIYEEAIQKRTDR